MFDIGYNVGMTVGAETETTPHVDGGDGGEAAGSAEAVHAARASLLRAIAEGRSAVGSLSPDQIWTCSDADVRELVALHAQLDALSAALGHLIVREADVRDLASKDGQVSTASWLMQKLTLHPGEAKARVKTAEMLSRTATATCSALVEGRVNADQARAIARGLDKIEAHASAEVLGEAEAFLLREGIGLHSGHITRLARHIETVLDPDGEEPKDRAERSRTLSVTDVGGGLHRIKGLLTDEAAALLQAALDPLAAPRPATKDADGHATERDTRTPGQRNHDALADLCRQFLRFGDLGTAHGARPHVHVTASIETMRGDTGHPFARTATGEDLDLATLQRIACDAGLTPILTDTLGVPLAMGRQVRTATPAQWVALVARDIGCIGEGCTRPASWCEAHHFPPWEHDGRTDLDKLALLCSHHHHLAHHDGWQVRLGADGHPEMIPPVWVDKEQRPRRNAHWKLIRNGLKC
jgi:hypothetical protein